jgi:HD-GYP domain-containing protein (c-di-GMP phosphodiesterase class II)
VKGALQGAQSKKDVLAAQLAAELSTMIDVELLLDKTVSFARLLSFAEAGTIYLLEEGKLRFATSQNDYLARSVGEEDELPFMGYNLNLDQTTLAGYAASQMEILTVNDTYNIDSNAPYQHFKIIDTTSNYFSRAIMSIPLTTFAGELMGVLQVINPLDAKGNVGEFSSSDEKAIFFIAQSAAMSLEKALLLRSSVTLTVQLLAAVDPMETTGHVQRVAYMSAEIYSHWAAKNKVPNSERDEIKDVLPLATMLHDVGKCWIPKEIFTKPGRLDVNERAIMEGHVLAGAKLFSKANSPLERLTKTLIMDHHERWDGRGYPGNILKEKGEQGAKGKKGEEISIYGRILAIADVYDALCNRKTYKEPFDESLSTQMLDQERGYHFDPDVVDCFMSIQPTLSKIMKRYPEPE